MISDEYNSIRKRNSFRVVSRAVSRLAARVRRLETQEPSWLNAWEAISTGPITTLTVKDHFREYDNEVWSEAGSPFVSADTPSIRNSTVLVWEGFTGTQRGFLYQSDTPASHVYACIGFRTTGSVGGNFEGGIRIDDGTDDNYIEFGLRVDSLSSDTRWLPISRERNGFSPIENTSGDDILSPAYPIVLQLNTNGTRWTNWTGTPLLNSATPVNSLMWKPNTGIGSGLSWTPTRVGIYVNGYSTTASWMEILVDWIYW